MRTLIIKLNAAGDVVRTTPLLHCLHGEVTWVTAQNNVILLDRLRSDLHCVPWENRSVVLDSGYDLVINLEDELEVAEFVNSVRYERLFGAYTNGHSQVSYTHDSCRWFDLSLISAYGKLRADLLKFRNRRTYQDLVFEGLGFQFNGEKYILPLAEKTKLAGDVAIAPAAGPVWPMKSWAHYEQLKRELEATGFAVNMLPHRNSLLEHIGDVKNHRCLVGGDSLPMHLALGVGTPCVTIFNCTSPWEIYGYGLQKKIISPLLGEFFYKRDLDPRATVAVTLEEVLVAVIETLAEQADAPQ